MSDLSNECIVCGDEIPIDHTCLVIPLHNYMRCVYACVQCEDGIGEALKKIDEDYYETGF